MWQKGLGRNSLYQDLCNLYQSTFYLWFHWTGKQDEKNAGPLLLYFHERREKYFSKLALEEASFADLIYEALSPCPFQPCRRQFHPSLQGSLDLWSWNCMPVYMPFSRCSLSININVVYMRKRIIFISWSSSFSMDTSGSCPSTGRLPFTGRICISQWFTARFLYLCSITDWVPHLNSGCMGWKSWPANMIITSGSDHPNISLSPAVHLFLAACFSCSAHPPVV